MNEYNQKFKEINYFCLISIETFANDKDSLHCKLKINVKQYFSLFVD